MYKISDLLDEHKLLIFQSVGILTKLGYEVALKWGKILDMLEHVIGRRIIDEVFARRNAFPDIVAVKDENLIIVEVKTRRERFVRQLENYCRLGKGKVILLLPFEPERIELCGPKSLEKIVKKI